MSLLLWTSVASRPMAWPIWPPSMTALTCSSMPMSGPICCVSWLMSKPSGSSTPSGRASRSAAVRSSPSSGSSPSWRSPSPIVSFIVRATLAAMGSHRRFQTGSVALTQSSGDHIAVTVTPLGQLVTGSSQRSATRMVASTSRCVPSTGPSLSGAADVPEGRAGAAHIAAAVWRARSQATGPSTGVAIMRLRSPSISSGEPKGKPDGVLLM